MKDGMKKAKFINRMEDIREQLEDVIAFGMDGREGDKELQKTLDKWEEAIDEAIELKEEVKKLEKKNEKLKKKNRKLESQVNEYEHEHGGMCL